MVASSGKSFLEQCAILTEVKRLFQRVAGELVQDRKEPSESRRKHQSQPMKVLACIWQKVLCWIGFHEPKKRGKNILRIHCPYCKVNFEYNGKVKKR